MAYDPPGDGLCLFSVEAHQLRQFNIHRSSTTIRAELVKFMRRVPDFNSGTHLQLYLLDENWESYLDRLVLTSHGLTTMALAVLFINSTANILIHVFSS